jgi:nitroreductase
MQSPSACNRQSYEYRLYDDPGLIEEISSLAIGASGYNDNIPCLAVIVGKQRAYFDTRDKHVIYIDASLSAMAFQFALETRGLASCCINWPAIPENEQKIETLLNLEPDECVIMLMAIGYPDPDGMIPYSEKKEIESLRSYNEI